MARIRTIKPETPQSQSMGRIGREARLCFILLWTLADDAGRLRGNSRMLASLLYPYDDDAKSLMTGWLVELEREGCILRYAVNGDEYIEICNWLTHQKIDKPSKSKIPSFDESSRILANIRERSSGDQGSEDQGPKDQGSGPPTASATPTALVPRETPNWFLNFKLAYPSRAGDQGWRKALRAANARLAEGHTTDEFIDGAMRYAAYCDATQNTDTAYVKQAATFLGPDKSFLLDWRPPASKAERTLESNISAGLQFLAGGKP